MLPSAPTSAALRQSPMSAYAAIGRYPSSERSNPALTGRRRQRDHQGSTPSPSSSPARSKSARAAARSPSAQAAMPRL